MNRRIMSKLLLILFVMGSLHFFSGEMLRAEEMSDRMTSADLEREIKELVHVKPKDLNQLLRLAGLYLDVGYGMYDDRGKKIAAFQEGARMAKKALALRETSADAHFLYAANLGSVAKLEGLMTAALTIQELKRHVHRVLELDAQHVPAYHMLGRMYEELPWFLGGDQKAAEVHFKQALSIDSRYAPARLDLARWYLKHGQTEEAVRELSRVVETPPLIKRWMWEQIHRPEAQELLQQIVAQENRDHSSRTP